MALPALASAVLAGPPSDAPASRSGAVPIGAQIWREHQFGPQHPLPPDDLVTDSVVAARRALAEEDALGRTVVEWVDLARASRWLALEAPATREADLATEVMRLSRLVGVEPDVAAIAAAADALAPELRAPFTALVAEVADAYEAQLPLARAVEARLARVDAEPVLLARAERDATLARAERIVGALNELRRAAAGSTTAAVFADPEGLVVLGGEGADAWARGGLVPDPVLLVDLGGDDLYLNSAGGASPSNLPHDDTNRLALSVVADLAGNDRYVWDGAPAAVQGAASTGALGILLDVEGSDSYLSVMTRGARGPFTQYMDGGSQGYATAAVGLQIDGGGDDVYDARVASRSAIAWDVWAFSQGWGGYGGLGMSADDGGNDRWLSYGLGITSTAAPCEGRPSNDECGFQGVYTDGAGFFGGVGIMSDTGGGDDVYRAYDNSTTTDYYAQGFGAFGGVGIMLEDGGDDDYTASQSATDPWISPLLNCAFGTGSLGGAGFFLELAGNDRYFGASASPRTAYVMNEGFGGIGAGYGLFVDVSGDDGHFMHSTSGDDRTFGRGVLLEHTSPLSGINTSGNGGANRAGNYLDLGGLDLYTGAPPSRDDAIWSGGADLELPSALILEVLR